MRNTTVNNIKLGVFTLAGLAFLVLLLYVIGKNRNIFGHTFELKARFDHAHGLKSGHNVRYAGIQVGTVTRVAIVNDTLMEATFVVDDAMRNIIRKNAIADIGTDGLMGSHVLNISPGTEEAPYVTPGNVLATRRSIDTDGMLQTLNITNNNIAFISEELKTTVRRINESAALWHLLQDEGLPKKIYNAANHLEVATTEAKEAVTDIHTLVQNVKQGKGTLGAIVADTQLAVRFSEAVLKINAVAQIAEVLAQQLQQMTTQINREVNDGKGMAHALLKDTTMVIHLQKTLENLQTGTRNFNENMEALKTNFLFRRYFKQKEKQAKQ